MNDHELAAALAAAAGQQLLELRQQYAKTTDEISADALAEIADASANTWILQQLATHRPSDAVLSEEAEDDLRRLDADRVWIIDPVDGTYEFARALADFAVHVALWDNTAARFLAAAVAVPEHASVWSTGGQVKQLPASSRTELTVVSSGRESKRVLELLGAALVEVAPQLGYSGVDFRRSGSVGGKVHRVLAGQADVYVSTSGFWEWDAAAPAAVAAEHGLVVTDMHGAQLKFNQAEPRIGSFVAARPQLHAHVIAALSGVAQ